MKGKDTNNNARQIITMDEHGNVTIPNGEIWMGEYEIANLFGVFGHSVRTAGQGNIQGRAAASLHGREEHKGGGGSLA